PAGLLGARPPAVRLLRRAGAAAGRRGPGEQRGGAPRALRPRRGVPMYHDGVAFVAVCILTRGTIELPLPLVWRLAGAALVAVGVGVKLWAAATLGADGYYWRDFFEREIRPVPTIAGPYRWLRNPMYTVGYLQ